MRLLQLPNTMVYLLWPGGVVLQVLSFVTTLYTLWQMCAMHEIKGKRFNRYHELGQYAWGQKLGLWLVIPCQVTLLHRPFWYLHRSRHWNRDAALKVLRGG